MVNFKAPYSKEDALSFLDKFLPEDFQQFDEKIEVDFKSQFVRNIKKIGEAPSFDNLHIYEITHESENDPRVSLSKDSFRLLAHFNVRKALIFFVSKTSPNYRFSLVTVDLKWESGAKVRREYSNPRRYSFFLGPDARVHTPNDFLIKKERVKDTVDLLSRFDVEIVTKEFFTKYKGLHEDVRGYLEKDHGFKIFANKNNIDIDSFAKKLLGQIVFCYFLQRKGWLGAKRGKPINKGDKDFMRSLFIRCGEGKNFYNDYLEHFFYGSLNNKAEGSSDFYRKHFDCQVPFLNGGLFEPPEDYDWEKSFVHIPDKIFSNKENTGILDVFDLYNFTVYEDDPIDREVSVDPEMLGKVFENLLPENLRKGQGAYYTPREIVHYMCQESLINYLATETKVDLDKIRDLVINKHFEGEVSRESVDKTLEHIKVCDPACGSGAFLVGMLHAIVSARHILNPKQNEYHLKKETIQNCIYGVDIDPGAVEIAKLRLWLSLVVDYELKDVEPLPNLDYKIMCGNSLLEEFEGVRFYDGDNDDVTLFKDERKQKIQELRKKVREYFNIYDEKEKHQKKEEINKLKDWFIKVTLEKRRKEITRERKKIEAKADMFQEKNRQEYFTTQGKIFVSEAKINEVLRELHNPQKARPFFIWRLEFMDVFESKGGFDIVIANPPYLEARSPDFSEIMKNELHIAIKNQWGDNIYDYIGRGCDLLIYFLLESIRLANNRGHSIFLTQNAWLDTVYGQKFQKLLLNQCYVKAIIDSDYKYFDDRFGPNINTVITIFQKIKLENIGKEKTLFARFHVNFENTSIDTLGLLSEETEQGVHLKRLDKDYLQSTLIKWGILLSVTNEIEGVINKLLHKGKFLHEINADCGQGLNLNKRFLVNNETIKLLNINDNAFLHLFSSDDGAPFLLHKTKQHLVLRNKIDSYTINKLEKEGYDLFDLNMTNKSFPILILPRGIGRHFCSFNKVNAFSASGVDIYLSKSVQDFDDIRIRLWVFLNSSLCWLIRELSGRKNLGGGMLKAEAVDLKNYPLYLNNLNLKKSEEIFSLLSKREAKTTIDEIDSKEHILIDNLVFDCLDLNVAERKAVISNLKSIIIARGNKAQSQRIRTPNRPDGI